jgi:hypothetical protein
MTIFESEFYSIFILYYLAGLFRIPVCLNGFLLWPLVGTEKVRSSHLAPGWYRESLICIIFRFIISRVVISFWRYGNWKYNLLILLGFYLRDFATHSDGVIPADVGVTFLLCYFGLYIILYYYYFIYSMIVLFYSFSLLYARLVVRTWQD